MERGGLTEIFLKCKHRQDIVKFPHHIQNHLKVKFVMRQKLTFNEILFEVYAASPLFILKHMHHQN
jgi:hypothetical protein